MLRWFKRKERIEVWLKMSDDKKFVRVRAELNEGGWFARWINFKDEWSRLLPDGTCEGTKHVESWLPARNALQIPRNEVSEMSSDKLKTALSTYAHDAWSGWMKYLFECSSANPDGSVTIPKALVERWQRQLSTPYSELPPNEQASDDEEAEKMIAIFQQEQAE